MRRIPIFGMIVLVENIYYVKSLRKFYMQAFVCKLLPAVLTNLIKIICSGILSKKRNKKMFFQILTLAVIFEIHACFNAFHTAKITGIYHAVALNSKVIFVAFLAYFMLKKSFSFIQIVGQCIIFAGICWGGCNTNNVKAQTTMNTTFSFCAILTSTFMASLGNVYFEKYVRRNISDFHKYNMQISIVQFFLSMLTASTEIFTLGMKEMVPTVSNYLFYNYVIVFVVHTYLLTYISIKVEPIVRSFMFLVIATLRIL